MKRLFALTRLLSAVTAVAVASPALASHSTSETDNLPAFQCPCKAKSEVVRAIHEEIAAAENVEQARDQALASTRTARAALRRARWVAPWSDDIKDAYGRMKAYEENVREASDQESVAAEFAALVQLASVGVSDAWVGSDGSMLRQTEAGLDGNDDGEGCDYSTGEVIAIVVGFILGIIPGVILLFVLC